MQDNRNKIQLILEGAVVVLLAITALQLFQLVKVERADLKRQLGMDSSVNCFALNQVEEMVDIQKARENCRYEIYGIESEFGW